MRVARASRGEGKEIAGLGDRLSSLDIPSLTAQQDLGRREANPAHHEPREPRVLSQGQAVWLIL